MYSTQGGLSAVPGVKVEENLNGRCIILLQGGVSEGEYGVSTGWSGLIIVR